MAYKGVVHRWDVFWADLEPVVGSEQEGESRPVMVVSNDAFNRHFPLVTVLPLTTHGGEGRKVFMFEVEVPAGMLQKDRASIVMPHQVRTISKLRLLEPLARLEDVGKQLEIENAMLDHLGIPYDA